MTIAAAAAIDPNFRPGEPDVGFLPGDPDTLLFLCTVFSPKNWPGAVRHWAKVYPEDGPYASQAKTMPPKMNPLWITDPEK
jgi:hypothetical protein